MKITKGIATLNLSVKEVNTLQDACVLFDKIVSTMEHDNYHWLIFDETGQEIHVEDVDEMSDKISSFVEESRIEVC